MQHAHVPRTAPDALPTDSPRPSVARSHRRVLLAEDDADLRVGLARLLRQQGHAVCEVSDGARLLEELASWLLDGEGEPADVVVSDVRMPGVNGLSIAEGLRAGGYSGPIVLISAFGDDEMHERVARLPHVSFLPKPLDPAQLDALVRSAPRR